MQNFRIPNSLSAEDIVYQVQSDPNELPWVEGGPVTERIYIVDYDPEWPHLFQQQKSAIRSVLNAAALKIEHIGSTAVPGLPAKPVIDIDLTVPDSSLESQYIQPLTSIGYHLVIREPSWYQHRCFRMDKPRVNLHVFSPDCPETIRHILFRDWLREHADDRGRYAAAKYEAARNVTNVLSYNRNKNDVVAAIYNRIFKAIGLLS
ncbi:GrpB family protein [Parapedobacter sp. GCM10030251]|jgi:Uncharacterized conserved protein|uniref:GrpB family protein n=1 Tax=Parapedobacter sp. GCM10030251 TaxID=3273419 RepID=UPI003613810B